MQTGTHRTLGLTMNSLANTRARINAFTEQHRWLDRICEDYRRALDTGHGSRTYSLLLDTLRQYLETHLESEDATLNCSCRVARANRRAADSLVFATLDRLELRFAQHGFSERDAHDLLASVQGWLSGHIARVDIEVMAAVPSHEMMNTVLLRAYNMPFAEAR